MKHSLLSVWLLALALILAACGAVEPQPGATLVGSIAMDTAKSAQITLTVSGDGQAIEKVNIQFTGLTCEGLSAESTSTIGIVKAPIVEGKFEFSSSRFGEISGRFTSPATAQGSAHLVFLDGGAECGTWGWRATAD